MNILFLYKDILHSGGMPEHFQVLLEELNKINCGVNLFICDYKRIFSYKEKIQYNKEIKFNWVITTIDPSKTFLKLFKFKYRGSKIIVFTFGMLTKDFSKNNWFDGKRNLIYKRIGIKLLKIIYDKLVTYYFVSDSWEIRNSAFDIKKCICVPTFSKGAILRNRSLIQRSSTGRKGILYFGRAEYYRKGINKIIDLASKFSEVDFLLIVSNGNDFFKEKMNTIDLKNVIVDYNSKGKDLLKYIPFVDIFIMLSPHPAPLRSVCESLLLGLPVLTSPQTCSHELQKYYEIIGLKNVVTIIKDNRIDINELLGNTNNSNRFLIKEAAEFLFDAAKFAFWLIDLLEGKIISSSYLYDISIKKYATNKL